MSEWSKYYSGAAKVILPVNFEDRPILIFSSCLELEIMKIIQSPKTWLP